MPQPKRRRGRSDTPTVKKSFTIHRDLVLAAEAAVRAGQAENLSAFVERSITEQLQRDRRAVLKAAYAKAARDPAFLADMESISRDLDPASPDGLGD